MDVSMQQCALLKTLSREVRDKIWAEIVSPTGFVLLEFNSSSRTIRLGQQLDRGTWCGPVVELFPLYSTCKQIHEEAEKVFYLENVVRIAPRITTARYNSYDLYRLDLLLHIRPTILTGLQHLQLSLNIGHFLSDRDNTALQTICFCKKFKTYFNFWNAAVSFTGLVTLRLALTGIDGEVLTLGDLRHISRVDAGGVSHREILNDRVKKCLNLVYEIGQWKWGGAEKSIILDVTTEDGKPGPEYWVRKNLDSERKTLHQHFHAKNGKAELWHVKSRHALVFTVKRRQLVLTDEAGREAYLSTKWAIFDWETNPNIFLGKLAKAFYGGSLYIGSRLCYHAGNKLSDPFTAINVKWWDVYETSPLNEVAFETKTPGDFIMRELQNKDAECFYIYT